MVPFYFRLRLIPDSGPETFEWVTSPKEGFPVDESNFRGLTRMGVMGMIKDLRSDRNRIDLCGVILEGKCPQRFRIAEYLELVLESSKPQ